MDGKALTEWVGRKEGDTAVQSILLERLQIVYAEFEKELGICMDDFLEAINTASEVTLQNIRHVRAHLRSQLAHKGVAA